MMQSRSSTATCVQRTRYRSVPLLRGEPQVAQPTAASTDTQGNNEDCCRGEVDAREAWLHLRPSSGALFFARGHQRLDGARCHGRRRSAAHASGVHIGGVIQNHPLVRPFTVPAVPLLIAVPVKVGAAIVTARAVGAGLVLGLVPAHSGHLAESLPL